jgi:hypothetical protein
MTATAGAGLARYLSSRVAPALLPRVRRGGGYRSIGDLYADPRVGSWHAE